MLESVVTGNRTLNGYCPVVGKETVQNLRVMAEPMRGTRVLHINATPVRGRSSRDSEFTGTSHEQSRH